MVAMRFALITVFAVSLVSCGETAPPFVLHLPTAPNPPVAAAPDPPPAPPVPAVPDPPARPPELTFVVVMVLGGGDGCIDGAVVEIVRGQGLGRRVTQSARGCGPWDGGNVIFRDLNVGEELTLRASAAGYAANEETVIPTPGGQFAIPIVLSRIQ
jgi:hypothetical protein